MEKLKLNIDALTVESFQSAEVKGEGGTVEARGLFASVLHTCADTNCGQSFCVTLPCAC